jgi:hypothetical protein
MTPLTPFITFNSIQPRQQHDLATGEFRWTPIIRAANVKAE